MSLVFVLFLFIKKNVECHVFVLIKVKDMLFVLFSRHGPTQDIKYYFKRTHKYMIRYDHYKSKKYLKPIIAHANDREFKNTSRSPPY